jgi:hypothetical protein
MFKKLETINREKGVGALPDIEGIKKTYAKYFFDIDIVGHDEEYAHVRFWTKWAPPLAELIVMAKHFQGSWEVQVEELGMWIYGKIMLDNEGNHTEIWLDREVFEAVEETDDCQWKYKGEIYESDYDIYEMELERLLNTSVI